ncbi:CRISPR-associated helicase Cas3' [uncultured Photobacterium sp.]|uniref:CRISPR-associated helicase Cas3' n=1 Tax=uncultured Photobacterium sp. TaxID=173973 RepID=UPI0026305BCD|nr:CRISPR-associated helicase Cas3' [uncultured Photobacterium sp.]
MSFIAHCREDDASQQTVFEHLSQTSDLATQFAQKIGLPNSGKLLGLLHDFGKYSGAFQSYIKSAQGLIDPDALNYVDAKSHKGKIDHATAGAQYVYKHLRQYGRQGQGELCGQLLALSIASHHSGLIDTLAADINKGNRFDRRMQKADDKTHFSECCQHADPQLLEQLALLLGDDGQAPLVLKEMGACIRQILGSPSQANSITKSFSLGFLARFLFSCVVDADRLNSAEFSEPRRLEERLSKPEKPDWNLAIERLENKLTTLSPRNPIDHIRQKISQQCRQQASQPQGVYSLTVPTGGGKTYASLRYALHHACKHKMDRIFYIIPFTSIIEQNAAVIRDVLEQEGDLYPWVLEHHSSLEPEAQTWKSKISADNWDAPVVVTTMVQFLEALFAGGTRSVRRLHQLANSVLVFDEIQTLPINCTHLFCNALDFLVRHTGSTAVLCTATQPLLDKLDNPHKGQLSVFGELVEDVSQLFNDLKRVHVENACKPAGWELDEIAELVMSEFELKGSCLTVVNTKLWAQDLYQACAGQIDSEALFHLSTNQCPAHRKKLLACIRRRLDAGEPVMCFSTQLIEAGVDVDFATVIRFLAGLDSIAQAAGRCNRNGRQSCATVYVVNPREENTRMLIDIDKGKEVAQRVMNEGFDDLLCPQAMERYFEYYFYQQADDMDYRCKDSQQISTSLLKLLSNNSDHPFASNKQRVAQGCLPRLEQSFMEAGKIFQAINAPTQAVIVPYQQPETELVNGSISAAEIINTLCSKDEKFDAQLYYHALKQAQKYSVNVFPNVWGKLIDEQAVAETQPGSGVYYLLEQYYDTDFGLSTEPVSSSSFICC